MIRPAVLITGLAAAGLLIGISACTQHQAASGTASTPAPVEKAFTLTATAPFHVDFLTGQLQDLKITEQVDAAGKVAQPAELRGTLKITNNSKDQSAQLVGGRLVFLDGQGHPIPLGKDQDTSITFSSYDTTRLNPGQENSTAIDVPFPQAGLQADAIKSVQVDLTYLPTPYRSQSASAAVALKHG